MTASRYFVAAAILFLLGASAMPVGIAAYDLAGTTRGDDALAVGVWGSLVIIISLAGPLVLTVAGLVALGRRQPGSGRADDRTDPRIDEAMVWLSDEPQTTGRR